VLSHLPAKADYDLPFVVEETGAGWIAITDAGPESKTAGYPSTYLTRTGNGLITSLARSKNEPTVAFAGTTPLVWPWRVLLVGPSREHLLQSATLQSMNR
jgi:hypothetical protein